MLISIYKNVFQGSELWKQKTKNTEKTSEWITPDTKIFHPHEVPFKKAIVLSAYLANIKNEKAFLGFKNVKTH